MKSSLLSLVCGGLVSGGLALGCTVEKAEPPSDTPDASSDGACEGCTPADASETGDGAVGIDATSPDAEVPSVVGISELALDPGYSFVAYPLIAKNKLYALGVTSMSHSTGPRELSLFVYDLSSSPPQLHAKHVVEPDGAGFEQQPKLMQMDSGEVLIVSTLKPGG